jgi:protein disulfide-isomerase A6
MRFCQKFSTNFSILLFTAGSVICSNVLEVTQDNFSSIVVDSGIPTIVDIYASWCGHCKTLSPVWDKLASAYADKSFKIQVVKIDGDVNRDIADEYGVTSFPTLKYFDGKGNVEAVEVPRDLESLASFVAKKTGIPSNIKHRAPSAVVPLFDDTFDKIAYNPRKTVIVAFTAQWCGHCKNLKPAFEKVADIYRYDSDSIVLAEVDTTSIGTSELVQRFNIKNLPTILVFPDDDGVTEPIKYPGGRSVENFVEAINHVVGLDRNIDGTLGSAAGRFKELDEISLQFVDASLKDRKVLLEKLYQFVERGVGVELNSAKIYKRYAEKISTHGVEYLTKEINRLSAIIKNTSTSRSKIDEMKKKINILRTFALKSEIDEENDFKNEGSKDEISNDEL